MRARPPTTEKSSKFMKISSNHRFCLSSLQTKTMLGKARSGEAFVENDVNRLKLAFGAPFLKGVAGGECSIASARSQPKIVSQRWQNADELTVHVPPARCRNLRLAELASPRQTPQKPESAAGSIKEDTDAPPTLQRIVTKACQELLVSDLLLKETTAPEFPQIVTKTDVWEPSACVRLDVSRTLSTCENHGYNRSRYSTESHFAKCSDPSGAQHEKTGYFSGGIRSPVSAWEPLEVRAETSPPWPRLQTRMYMC